MNNMVKLEYRTNRILTGWNTNGWETQIPNILCYQENDFEMLLYPSYNRQGK